MRHRRREAEGDEGRAGRRQRGKKAERGEGRVAMRQRIREAKEKGGRGEGVRDRQRHVEEGIR